MSISPVACRSPPPTSGPCVRLTRACCWSRREETLPARCAVRSRWAAPMRASAKPSCKPTLGAAAMTRCSSWRSADPSPIACLAGEAAQQGTSARPRDRGWCRETYPGWRRIPVACDVRKRAPAHLPERVDRGGDLREHLETVLELVVVGVDDQGLAEEGA